MARAKRESDRVYNERRRARRAAERARKAGNVDEARRFERAAQATYYDRKTKGYAPDIKRTRETIRYMRERQKGQRKTRISKEERSNRAFIAEMRKASKGLPSAITTRTGFAASEEASIFFMATRHIWERVPGGANDPMRAYAAIEGFANYQDAYDYVMGQQQDALRRLDETIPKSMQIPMHEINGDLMPQTELSYAELYQQLGAYINVMR